MAKIYLVKTAAGETISASLPKICAAHGLNFGMVWAQMNRKPGVRKTYLLQTDDKPDTKHAALTAACRAAGMDYFKVRKKMIAPGSTAKGTVSDVYASKKKGTITRQTESINCGEPGNFDNGTVKISVHKNFENAKMEIDRK